MAAGMGSRYGGLKQIDPVSEEGEIILEFSLYDALRSGFKRVVFVIRREMEKDFRELIEGGAGKHLDAEYVSQELSDLPEGYKVPAGRVKPWGTCHAALSCRRLIGGPFALINADDFYGAEAFRLMHDFLTNAKDDGIVGSYGMIGYRLENTLTENGHVARGVCELGENGFLSSITERKKIMRREGGIMYSEDGETWTETPDDSTVSMNFWGFTPGMMRRLEEKFPIFLDKALAEDPLKAEYLLPTEADALLKEKKAVIRVLKTKDKWYGVTYKEDQPTVKEAVRSLKSRGLYPARLWE
jgi:hypothetical protein